MIQNLKLYVVLNSSGAYALLVKLWTRSGIFQAKVPVIEGTSEGVRKMRNVFSTMRPNFIGLSEEDWVSFDSFLEQLNSSSDVSPSLSLALSVACARAATQNDLWKIKGAGSWFPYIMGTVALGKDWKEFTLIPYRETSVADAFSSLKEAWKVTGEELKQKGFLRGRTNSGAWLSDLSDIETLYFLDQIAKDWKMRLGLNIGASALWDPKAKTYNYRSRGMVIRKDLDPDEHMSLLSAIAEQYKIWYMEDPFHSADVMSHAYLTHKLEDTVISGCDLYGADIGKIKSAAKLMSTRGISVNPRDLSTISQLAEIAEFAKGRGLKLTLSRFSTETEDNWLADLALAMGADMLKLGIMGADNVAKYSRLLEMWEDVPSPKMGLSGLKADSSQE